MIAVHNQNLKFLQDISKQTKRAFGSLFGFVILPYTFLKFYYFLYEINKLLDKTVLEIEKYKSDEIEKMQELTFLLDDYSDEIEIILDGDLLFDRLFHNELDRIQTKLVNTVTSLSNKMVKLKIDDNRKNTTL